MLDTDVAEAIHREHASVPGLVFDCAGAGPRTITSPPGFASVSMMRRYKGAAAGEAQEAARDHLRVGELRAGWRFVALCCVVFCCVVHTTPFITPLWLKVK